MAHRKKVIFAQCVGTFLLACVLIFAAVDSVKVSPNRPSLLIEPISQAVSQSFPKPFPPRNGLSGKTSVGTPYLMMRTFVADSNDVMGVRLAELQSVYGENVITALEEVTKLAPGTYFKLVQSTKANSLPFDVDVVEISEASLADELKKYHESGMYWGP